MIIHFFIISRKLFICDLYDLETIENSSLSFTEATYKNLCDACNNPASCYMTDKYYGRQGALLCLTDNVGDVVWTRLDDAKLHFKVTDRSAS